MYRRKRTSGPKSGKQRLRRKENSPWFDRISIQLMVCLLLFSAARGNGLLPDGSVQEAMSMLLSYGRTDYSAAEAAETLSRGVSALWDSDPVPRMSWPCNEIETMALAADSSSQIYTFSSEEPEMPVFASCGGTVQEILDGRIVISHGNGLETVYGGCTQVYVQTLQKVRRGELIASIRETEEEHPQLSFQILKEQKAVDIGDYLHED